MSFSFPPPNQFTQVKHTDDPSTFPYPGVPVDKGACRLLGPTALVVQALMGGLVIASLVFKRQREKPMRPWRIWLFDVSKQILGQAFVHGLNLLISGLVAHLAQGNPCDLYFLNVLIDTTIGVAYIYLILHGADKLFTDHLKLKGFKSGQYGNPPSIAYWGRQATVYVFIILTMKLFVVGLFAAWPGIFDVGEWLLGWTAGSDRLQVIFVMGIFPIIMNVLQFWLIDSIVKASASMSANDGAQETSDSSREPLFRDPDSDSEDDDTIRAQRRHDIESPPTPQQKPHPSGGNIVENKSLASGSSSTHASESDSTRLHSYPPQRSSSTLPLDATDSYNSPLSSTSASTSSSSVSSMRSKKFKRRSPPPPIRRPPPHESNGGYYTISVSPSPTVSRSSQRSLSSYTTPSSPTQTQPRQRHRSTLSQGASRAKVLVEPEARVWDSWAEGEGWAEKVGEEEWTGRRIDVTKADLDRWGSKGSAGVEVS